jgi:hypothetical protein
VLIIGWDINSDISLDPAGEGLLLRQFLNRLLKGRRDLRVRLLIWTGRSSAWNGSSPSCVTCSPPAAQVRLRC